ncbi:MAG: hypothetical protein QOD38_1803, partial [Acidimicrobiaceae bacterium]
DRKVRGPGRRLGGDGVEHGSRPGPVGAGPIEAIEATVDVGAIVGAQPVRLGQHGPRVGLVDEVELHPVDGRRRFAA